MFISYYSYAPCIAMTIFTLIYTLYLTFIIAYSYTDIYTNTNTNHNVLLKFTTTVIRHHLLGFLLRKVPVYPPFLSIIIYPVYIHIKTIHLTRFEYCHFIYILQHNSITLRSIVHS